MFIKISSHARYRLKERFPGLKFNGEINYKEMKFVKVLQYQDAELYRYKTKGKSMYLFMGSDEPTLITVMPPLMYHAWEWRYSLRKKIKKVVNFFGYHGNSYDMAKRVVDFILPKKFINV